MRRDGIPYVKNVPGYYPPVDYKKLTLKELTEKFIKPCAKAGGNVSVCSKCQNPCEYGKRAIQLVANEVYNDPPVPLYGGKTMIERAKEENMLRRAEREKIEAEKRKAEEEMKQEKKKRKYTKDDDWWEKSLESGDQVEWLVREHKLSKTQAKKKIYMYKYNHPELAPKKEEAKVESPVVKTEPVVEKHKEERVPSKANDIVIVTMEQKLAELMNLQEEYKANMEKYTKLYNEAKEQADILCKTMEMFS